MILSNIMSTENSQHGTDQGSTEETSVGLEEDVAGALTYLLGFVTGIIFLLVEEDNERVQFHAAQSIVVFGALFVISIIMQVLFGMLASAMLVGGSGVMYGMISSLMSLILMAIGLAGFILWIYLMLKTYQGEDPRIPVAAGIADDLA